jgi:hypothetical protein
MDEELKLYLQELEWRLIAQMALNTRRITGGPAPTPAPATTGRTQDEVLIRLRNLERRLAEFEIEIERMGG